MTRKELDRLDDYLAAEYRAELVGALMNGFDWVRIYQSATQKILVEVRDGTYTIFTYHSEGPK